MVSYFHVSVLLLFWYVWSFLLVCIFGYQGITSKFYMHEVIRPKPGPL